MKHVGYMLVAALSAVQPISSFGAEVGRYQIVTNPNLGRDTFLIDTATGQVWQLVQLTDIKDEPLAWKLMNHFDYPETLEPKGAPSKPTSPPK
jgi:hypothetical protein